MNHLNKGIKFENSDIFLEWGIPIEKLFKLYGSKKEERGDRTIYHWGKQTILNGLELELSNMYWKSGEEKEKRFLESIGFWAIGDDIAVECFNKISNHLSHLFGEPIKENINGPSDKLYTWQLDEVGIRLNFFDQHCYKLHLEIKKNKTYHNTMYTKS